MRFDHRVAFAMLLMLLLCGCGGGWLKNSLNHNSAGEVKAFRLENQDPATGDFISLEQEEIGNTVEVRLRLKQTKDLSQILYHLYYDASRFSPLKSEIHEALGSPEQAISLAVTNTPGLVALGQVRTGLEAISVISDTLVATVSFNKSPLRQSASASTTDAGLLLRSNIEFENADVPLRLNPLESGGYEVAWEEANDGDFNGDGEVNLQDITPIGQRWARKLCYTGTASNQTPPEVDGFVKSEKTTGWFPCGYYLYRSEAEDGLAHLGIKRISAVGKHPTWLSGLSAHDPVIRYDNEFRPIDYWGEYGINGMKPPDRYNPSIPTTYIYNVTIAEMTTLGMYWHNSVRSGYDVYIGTCATGVEPEAGVWVSSPQKIGTVNRPSSLSTPISQLGMGDFNDELDNPATPDIDETNRTYAQFCTTTCDYSGQRLGEVPLSIAAEPIMYKKVITKDIIDGLQPGDTYIIVTPLPGSIDTEFGGLGAYTYIKLVTNAPATPVGITWLNEQEIGIQALELGWPGGGPRQLRLKWGQAQLNWGSQTPIGAWEVRYAIYYSTAANTLWPAGLTVPQYPNSYYPPGNSPGNLQVIDLLYPGAGNYYVLPDTNYFAGQTVFMGVRAYPYLPQHSEGGVTIPPSRLATDSNTDSLNQLIPPLPPTEDTSQPVCGVNGSWLWTNFSRAMVLTTVPFNDPPNGSFTAVPLRRYHRDGSPGTWSQYHSSYWLQEGYFPGNVADVDEHGGNRNLSDLEGRLEVYRTKLDEQTMRAQITAAGSFIAWRATKLPLSTDFERYGIAMDYPNSYGGFQLYTNITNTNIGAQFSSWLSNSDGTQTESYATNLCPPLPGTFYWDDDNLAQFYDNDSFELDLSVYLGRQYYIDSYRPGNEVAWQQFGVGIPIQTKCQTEFTYNDFGGSEQRMSFVADDLHEGFENSRWNYFTIYAFNDPANNCSYTPVHYGEGIGSWLAGDSICWHGPIPIDTGNPYDYREEVVTRDDFTTTLDHVYAGYNDTTRGPSSVGPSIIPRIGKQVRYPDLAWKPIGNTLGISFFDPIDGIAKLKEINFSSRQVTCQDVDDASCGDTSVSYDLQGTPHVAYIRLLGSNGIPVPGVEYGHVTSSLRQTSHTYTGGIFYRKRPLLQWSPREVVDDAAFLNDAEHDIFINPLTQLPYCIIPSDALSGSGLPGIPAKGVKSGSSWSVSPLPPGYNPTDMYLDSIQVSVGSSIITYVAMYDAVMNQLKLGQLNNLQVWNWIVLDANDVRGYPSLTAFPDGHLGIAYMAGPDNRLRYGIYSGGIFTMQYQSPHGDCGYQTANSYDSQYNPMIFSIDRKHGNLLLTRRSAGGKWYETGMGGAACGDDLLDSNTVSAVRGPNDLYVVWIRPWGSLGVGHFLF